MVDSQAHQAPHPLPHVLFAQQGPIQAKEQLHVAYVLVAGHQRQRELDPQPLVASVPKARFLVTGPDHVRYAA